jgi:hypothetical protein
MLTLEAARRQLLATPLLVRVGLTVMVFAGLGDVVAHLEVADHVGHLHEHATAEYAAHFAGFVGMVLVFAGVVVDGFRHSRARREAVGHLSKGES